MLPCFIFPFVYGPLMQLQASTIFPLTIYKSCKILHHIHISWWQISEVEKYTLGKKRKAASILANSWLYVLLYCSWLLL